MVGLSKTRPGVKKYVQSGSVSGSVGAGRVALVGVNQEDFRGVCSVEWSRVPRRWWLGVCVRSRICRVEVQYPDSMYEGVETLVEVDLRGANKRRTRTEVWLIPKEQVTLIQRTGFELLWTERRRVRRLDSFNVAYIIECRDRKPRPSQVPEASGRGGRRGTCSVCRGCSSLGFGRQRKEGWRLCPSRRAGSGTKGNWEGERRETVLSVVGRFVPACARSSRMGKRSLVVVLRDSDNECFRWGVWPSQGQGSK